MEIVIKIPEDEYNIAKYGQYGNINVDIVRKAIANGTPLPKGHGRLVDADALEKKMTEYINTLPLAYDEAERIVLLMNHFDDAPTIIEGSENK